jgi:hypothetical protein
LYPRILLSHKAGISVQLYARILLSYKAGMSVQLYLVSHPGRWAGPSHFHDSNLTHSGRRLYC